MGRKFPVIVCAAILSGLFTSLTPALVSNLGLSIGVHMGHAANSINIQNSTTNLTYDQVIGDSGANSV